LAIVASLALEWILPTTFTQGAFRWNLGAIFFVAGLALSIAGFVTQKRAGTDPIPFNPSTCIVAHGPYRFSRNPMYIGLAVLTVGIAFLVDCAWILLAVPIGLVVIDRLVITREERYLERKFGEEYLSYKRRVRRWI
jgi:protein-S-isoprenylcysteine O-methyltransferase Ste14